MLRNYTSFLALCVYYNVPLLYESKCGPVVISNKIKKFTVRNPGASGLNLREVLFAESFEFGTTKQSLSFMLYLLVRIEKDYDEVWDNIRYQIYGGKEFIVTPLT